MPRRCTRNPIPPRKACSSVSAIAWKTRAAAAPAALRERAAAIGIPDLAASLGIGEPTLCDIIDELIKPGRDPREELPPVVLRSDVLDMDDLKPGMKLRGTVRNVTDFGALSTSAFIRMVWCISPNWRADSSGTPLMSSRLVTSSMSGSLTWTKRKSASRFP